RVRRHTTLATIIPFGLCLVFSSEPIHTLSGGLTMPRTVLVAFTLAFVFGAASLQAGDELPFPNSKDSTARLLQYLDDKDGHVRAAAIDLLGSRKAREAIPKLRNLLSDGTALRGSDHYVAQHAANALTLITGMRVEPFESPREEKKIGPGLPNESVQEMI